MTPSPPLPPPLPPDAVAFLEGVMADAKTTNFAEPWCLVMESAFAVFARSPLIPATAA